MTILSTQASVTSGTPQQVVSAPWGTTEFPYIVTIVADSGSKVYVGGGTADATSAVGTPLSNGQPLTVSLLKGETIFMSAAGATADVRVLGRG